MSEIPKLPYNMGWTHGGWYDVPEGMFQIRVTDLDGTVLLEKLVTDSDDVQKVTDEFVKSQGWMTFAEWNRKYPLRYKVWIDEYYDGIEVTEQVCTDRLTGKTIFRYDLGDPANYCSSHGGISDTERFENRKLDRYERVRIEDCKVKD